MKMWFNAYASVQQAFVHRDDMMCAEFADFATVLEENFKQLERKEDGMLFNLCKYKSTGYETPNWVGNETRPKEELIRRCKSNVEKIYCLLLDVDGTQSMVEAMTQWQDYEYVLYTTFGHTAEREKFRMVIPLETALTVAEFDSRHAAMCELFKVDGASFTVSQAFYFPSYSAANADERIYYWNKSALRYDALMIPALDRQRNASSRITLNPNVRCSDMNSELVYQAVLSCRDVHYADALPVATLMKSKGLEFEHFRNVVNTVAAADSMLRTDAVSLRKLWDQGYNRITHRRATELLQKLGCSKWPWRVERAA